ncbi:MAG: hypothetical protein ACRELD_09595 [Longimicrobiales bacterium]
MSQVRPGRTAAVSLPLLAFALACDTDGPAAISAPDVPASASLSLEPLTCATTETTTDTFTVDGAGATFTHGKHRIVVPAGAVDVPTEIEYTVPASSVVEIRVRANGQEHFTFAEPLSITISYARCPLSLTELLPLVAWYWDPATGVLLEAMPSTDDKDDRSVTFSTDHFSGYVIAN